MHSKLAGFPINFVKVFLFLTRVLSLATFFVWLTYTRLHDVCLQALAKSLRVGLLHLVKHNSVILPHCSFFSSPRVGLLASTKSPICPPIRFMLWKLYQRQNSLSLQTGTTRWVRFIRETIPVAVISKLGLSWFLAPRPQFINLAGQG